MKNSVPNSNFLLLLLKAFGKDTEVFLYIHHLASIGYPFYLYSQGIGMIPGTTPRQK